ncbi:ArsR family transcriptional regulator [Leptolyngbya valderiana BDU 20041]|uniref:ArsR/SmtB family transcription factor n=1 Tax=Baaleninema simplex TaxID=2862350 RepID=UPI000346D087|nr:metalloregulator ArsR/SmtB family transcription factor [Baaleninema simplex]MDC0832813.1 metalloregulator ArsR/SmtB family transcription factor [Geitlerinema sp. CS-897]OAB60792.1 ArsR family transcriptional regulator [Leptolyngbya valderiana BDU 20041]PPT10249.1 transcriptional regulator [Geitlerinema sp. FC II]
MSDRLSAPSSTSDCGLIDASPEALETIADFFKVLSEVNRLRIVCCLKSGDKNVSQIIETTGLGQANVSKHLKLLSQAGIVSRNQQGVNVFYSICNPLVFPLCNLVCQALTAQMQQRSEQVELLKSLQQSFDR